MFRSRLKNDCPRRSGTRRWHDLSAWIAADYGRLRGITVQLSYDINFWGIIWFQKLHHSPMPAGQPRALARMR